MEVPRIAACGPAVKNTQIIRYPAIVNKSTMAKIYRYHVCKSNGERIESNIPERHQAQTLIDFLEQTQGMKDLYIEQEHCPQLTGIMGRDPDLH